MSQLVQSGTTVTVLSCFLLLVLIKTVNGQCYGVTVSGASLQPYINGYYYMLDNVLCNGYNIWTQQYVSGQQYGTNYMTFLPKNTNGSATDVWAIGPSLCKTISIVLAYNQVTGYQSAPYQLPETWQELDPYTGLFVTDPNMQVYCTETLSAGAIVGIVIGCVCLLAVILSLLACICTHKKTKRVRQTQHPNATTVTTVYTTNNPSVYPNNMYGPPAAVIVTPPAYATGAPPGYYDYANPTKQPIDQSQGAPVAAGVTNTGYMN